MQCYILGQKLRSITTMSLLIMKRYLLGKGSKFGLSDYLYEGDMTLEMDLVHTAIKSAIRNHISRLERLLDI